MTEEKRIGMLGAGNLAGALIRGLLSSGTVDKQSLRASDVRPARLRELAETHGITTHEDNGELVDWAEVVVLAVKPQTIASVLDQIKPRVGPDTLVISVAAGVPIAALQSRLSAGTRLIRVMPNTPALVGAGAAAIARSKHASDEDLGLCTRLFEAVGRAAVVDESLLDVATGLSGSGPAYVMVMIEALAAAAVRLGMTHDTALLLAAQTIYGAARLQLETGTHPAVLRDQVTSPGGTTAAGLFALESGALRATLGDAVEAATDRAAELGAALLAKSG